MFVGKTDKESLRRRAWWRHSLDTAIGAKALATWTRTAGPEDAYTCGLMHLIGKTLMDRYGGHDYDNVLHLVGCEWAELDAERSVYGYTHVEAAVAAADHWGFPELLVEGLDYLTPTQATEACASHRACTAIAHIVCNELAGDEAHTDLPSWALASLKLDPAQESEIRERIGEAIARAGMSAG